MKAKCVRMRAGTSGGSTTSAAARATVSLFAWLLAWSCGFAVGASPDFWKAEGRQAAVVAGGAEAAEAAVEMLRKDGNAADAAVAAVLVLSVTDPGNFCFGGETPLLVYDARRDVVETICGLGVAPRLATVDYFARHKGGRIPGDNDPTTAAVPGAPDALLVALDRFGTKSLGEAAQPMLAVLDRGSQAWHAQLAARVRRMIEAERAAGPDRRRGLRCAADCFYRGSIARELDAWSRRSGGLLRYSDLATHATRIEDPVAIEYRGHRVVKCGPWTQGPMLLETLQLLEGFDVRGLGRNSPEYVHMAVEAMKLAMADRDAFYGDPAFVDVPLARLLNADYAALRRPLVDRARASLEQRPGDPRLGRALLGAAPADVRVSNAAPRDTTTCVVADRWGNVVAATPSGWAGVMAGDTGIRLGSRLRSLNTWPGHPNCIEPGKRPRITLTPTLVFAGGKPVLAISVAGGDVQDQVTLQLLLSRIEFGLSPAEAVTAPRFATDHFVGSFNQTPPKLGSLSLDEGFPKATADALSARGHVVGRVRAPVGHPVVLAIDPKSGIKQAAGDPKARRHARALP
jgi:gamma-glutamyltranspeptidase/glutathione hydrolase